jgi:hypothetical protein
LPGIETAPFLEADINHFMRLSETVKEFIPDVYNTPDEFKQLQVSFLKSIFKKVESVPKFQTRYNLHNIREFYCKMIQFFNSIKSFEACALVSKKMQQFEKQI